MTSYRDLESFYRDDPRRGRSPEADFGVWHGGGHSLRAVWLEQTGELIALTPAGTSGQRVELLGRLPRSGHPAARRSDLVAQAVLAGWAERSGHPDSLDWLRARLEQVKDAQLAPIDWTVACASEGCPRHGEAIAPESAEWAQNCPACLAPRLVTERGLAPGQLEAKLAGGSWWLADPRSARKRR